jgi:A/G-specific adenine glycosylase
MSQSAAVENSRWSQWLLGWYRRHQRILPWRSEPTPYRVWISEIMLQQTQVATATPYFERFLARFPDVAALAEADLQCVLKLWEGLGYYSRARNLHRAAQRLQQECQGLLPDSFEALQTLPGIGPYTAAAIASIAFNQPIPVVDGNVLRVFCRFWGIETDIRLPQVRNQLFARLTPVIQHCNPSEFNQAVMELGALVCRPQSPLCGECPLKRECRAFCEGRTAELPYKSKAKRVPHYNIGVGVIIHEGRILIARRGEDQMLGGLWEFPGGKQEPGESLPDTVRREVREEVALEVDMGEPLCTVKHAYSHFKITLTAFVCRVLSGEAVHHRGHPLRWVTPDELGEYPFPKANQVVLAALARNFNSV